MQVIPPALRGLGVGRIRPPNLVPQIVAAIVAAQQPAPIAAPAPAQPNNDAIIAAILAMQQPPAVVAPPPAPPAAPNNDIAIIAAILAMQQQPPPVVEPPAPEPVAPPVVIAKKPHVYDPDLDCVGNENDNDIGCVPNI